MTSKCGKNKEMAYKPQVSVSLVFLLHFDVTCDLLLNGHTATWNLFVYTMKSAIRCQALLPVVCLPTNWE